MGYWFNFSTGGMIVIDEDTSMVDVAKNLINFITMSLAVNVHLVEREQDG